MQTAKSGSTFSPGTRAHHKTVVMGPVLVSTSDDNEEATPHRFYCIAIAYDEPYGWSSVGKGRLKLEIMA